MMKWWLFALKYKLQDKCGSSYRLYGLICDFLELSLVKFSNIFIVYRIRRDPNVKLEKIGFVQTLFSIFAANLYLFPLWKNW